jgi:hypothetical protein
MPAEEGKGISVQALCNRLSVPSSRQQQKYWFTLLRSGRFFGWCATGNQLLNTYVSLLITAPSATLRLLPIRLACGICGLTSAHS